MLIASARPGWHVRACVGGLAASISLLGWVRAAPASENYPAIIDRMKGVECPRPLTRCLICHDSAAGGEGTANRPFAKALTDQYGLSGGKAGRELAMALEVLPEDVDTDADGVPDQEELGLCMNPSGGELSEGPGFGCNLRQGEVEPDITPGLPRGAAWLVTLLLMLVARRRSQLTSAPWTATALLLACTPTPIAEERFQSRAQTCYEFPQPGDAGQGPEFGSGLSRRDGCSPKPEMGGSGGAAATAAAGGSTGNAPGNIPPPLSGGGSTPAPPDSAAPDPHAAGDAGTPTGTVPPDSEQSPGALPSGCSEQAILEQFSRPYDVGGCTDPDGTGCHEDGTGEDPILADPDQSLSRLLDQRDEDGCGLVWIPSGAQRQEDSFLWRRLSQNISDEDCETQMPLDEAPLDDQTLACISAWIVWIGKGRPE